MNYEQDSKSKIRKTKFGKFAKILGYASIILFVILVILGIFTQSDFFKERAKTLITQEIQKKTQSRLVLGKIGGNFLTNIVLREVQLVGTEGELFYAHRINIGYFLPALFKKTFYIRELSLYNPRLILVRDEAGVWNYQKLTSQKIAKKEADTTSTPSSWNVVVKNIKVRGGFLAIVDHKHRGKQPLTQDIRFINLSAHLDFSTQNDQRQAIFSFKGVSFECIKPSLKVIRSRGKVIFDGTDLVINYLKLHTENSKGEVKGTIKNLTSPVLSLSANFPTLSFKDLQAFIPKVPLKGIFSTDIHVEGPREALKIRQKLVYNDLKIENYGVVDMGDMLRPKFSFQCKIRNFKPQNLLPAFITGCSKGKVYGNINLDIHASGEGREPSALLLNLKLMVLPSYLNEKKIESAEVNLSLRGKHLHIKPSVFQTPFGSCTFYGEGNIGGFINSNEEVKFNLKTNVRQLDISILTGREGLKSSLNFSSEIKGIKKPGKLIKDLLLAGSIRIEPSTVANLTLGESAIEGHLDGRHFSIGKCHITSDGAKITLSGQATLKEDIDFIYSLKIEDLKFIRGILPEIEVEGSLESLGKIGGTLRSFILDGTINGQNIRYRNLTLQSLYTKVKGRKDRKYLSGKLDLQASNILWKGVSIDKVNLYGSLDQEKFRFRLDVHENFTRNYRLVGTMEGIGSKVANIDLETIEIYTQPVRWRNKGPVQLSISRKKIDIHPLHMAYKNHEITCAGTIEFSQGLNLNLGLRSIDMSTIEKMARMKIPLKGKLDSDLSIKGNFYCPIITGGLNIREGNILALSFEGLWTTVQYAQRALDIEAVVEKNNKRLLRVVGTVPVDLALVGEKERLLSSGLALLIECKELDLAPLASLTKEVEKASGNVSLKAFLKGNPKSPSIHGDAYVSDGIIKISKTGIEYHEIKGHITFNNHAVTIEELSLKGGEGTANITGNVKLNDLKPYTLNLNLRCHKFKALDTRSFSGVVDADLHLKGPLNKGCLMGNITVAESTINIPEVGKRQIREIEIIETEEKEAIEVITEERGKLPSPVEKLSIDMEIALPGNTWVRGMGFNVELKGKLTLKKRQKEPVLILGKIQAIRGTYEFRGKTFLVKEGEVAFTGLPQMDATVSMKATCKVAKLTIIMLLGGTLTNPQVAFQSEPPVNQTDIFSYLLFGKPTDQLTQSQGIHLQETALGIVGGIAAKQLKRILGKRLSPDIIDVRREGGMGFEVGKYLTQGLFLSYERQFGLEESDQARLEYQVTDYFSINSQIGNEKTSGIDLFWTFDY